MEKYQNTDDNPFDCSRYHEQMSLYLDNALDETEAADFRRLMADHPDLAAQTTALQALLNGLHDLDDIPLPESFHDELMCRLTADVDLNSQLAPSSPKIHFWTVPWKRYSAIAAVFIACCFALTVIWQNIGYPNKNSSSSNVTMEMAKADTDSPAYESQSAGMAADRAADADQLDGAAVGGEGIYAREDALALSMEPASVSISEENHSISETSADTGITTSSTPVAGALTALPADSSSGVKQTASPDISAISVRTYSITLTTDQYAVAAEALNTYNRYIVSRNANDYGDYRYTNATLNVPAAQYEGIVFQLKNIGRIQSEYESETIIAFDILDTKASLRAREQEYSNLMGLLGRAETIDDILTIGTRLDQLNMEITGYENNLAQWNNQRDYPYIHISLESSGQSAAYPSEAKSLGKQMRDSFMESAMGLITVLEGVAVGLACAIFPLMALTLAVLVIFLAVKVTRRRKP